MMSPRARLHAILVSVGFVLFVLAARVLPPNEDVFPLSRFPMFAHRRPAQEPLPYVEVVLADGSRQRLGVSWWTTGGVSNGRNQLLALARISPVQRQAFCDTIAAKVVVSGEPWVPKADKLRVVAGLFNRDRLIRNGDLSPVRADPIVECALPFPSAGG